MERQVLRHLRYDIAHLQILNSNEALNVKPLTRCDVLLLTWGASQLARIQNVKRGLRNSGCGISKWCATDFSNS